MHLRGGDQSAEHAEGRGAAYRPSVAGALAAPYLLVPASASWKGSASPRGGAPPALLASASASASSWGIAPPAMATKSFSMEDIAPPMLAQTPIEKPSSAGSPILCSYSTSSPSETSGVAGFNRPPPKGRFTPEILPTKEIMPSSGGSVSMSAYSLPCLSLGIRKREFVIR